MKHLAREVALYAAVSAVAFVVDLLVLVTLVERAGVPYLPAAICGFVIGGLLAYALCVRFIFRFRRVEDRRVEATSFVVLGLAGLAVNAGGMAFGVEVLGLHYLVSKLGAASLSFFVNYALRRLALFTPLPAQSTESGET
jgi:putative flippase GtrA